MHDTYGAEVEEVQDYDPAYMPSHLDKFREDNGFLQLGDLKLEVDYGTD